MEATIQPITLSHPELVFIGGPSIHSWPSPLAIHLKLSHHFLLISYTPIQYKKPKKQKNLLKQTSLCPPDREKDILLIAWLLTSH